MTSEPSTVPSVALATGATIPQLGYGTFQVSVDETQRCVEDALAVGYRHIDTASAYKNEAGVGVALRAAGLPRDEVFVTTKLRNADQRLDRVEAALEASLTALGLDHLDLYLIHWPVPSAGRYVEVWRALEGFLADGRCRAIGVSNFLPEHLEKVLAEGSVAPAVNQIELYPGGQNREAAAATQRAGVVVEAYSPLGRGDYLTNPKLVEIADAKGNTPAQVVLAWHLAKGYVAIPKTTSAERMAENLAAARVQLTADEVAAIDALDEGRRLGGDPRTFDWPQT